jgi:hypothetical protein
VVEDDRQGQSPGVGRVWSGPMSRTTNPVRAYLSTLQDMANSTDFPTPKEHVRQLLTSIPFNIWRGTIFMVPLSTLQRQTEVGGIDLIDVVAKCRALFLTSFLAQGDRRGSLTAEWLTISQTEPPAHTCDPTDLRIPTHLFSRMDLYGTPRAG